jgi:hypothetical protein
MLMWSGQNLCQNLGGANELGQENMIVGQARIWANYMIRC